MALYTITCSTAYKADGTDLSITKEPWLHVRLLSIVKGKNIAWYAVVYVWDTREVVQWQKIEGKTNSLRWPKALDNGRPLKDKKGLLPGWAKDKLCGRVSPDKITQNGPYELTAKECSEI
jgi:hypothetical protein